MAGARPDATAWVNLTDGSELTFREWDAQSNRLARGLVQRGLAGGERVVIAIGPDQPIPWLIAYAAVHRAGAVAVPVNTRLAGPELVAILGHAQPSVVLASPATEGGVPWTELVDGVGLRLLATTGPDRGPSDFWTLFDPDPTALAGRADPEGSMDIMYTSGTTGKPKAVVVRHHPDQRAGRDVRWNGLGFMTASPFSTTSGALLIYGPMSGGMSGWYLPRFDADQWLSAVAARRPVVAFIVPAMAQLIVADPHFDEADLSSLAALTIGGAPIARGTLRRLGEQLPGTDILVGYGLTEFGAVTRTPSGDKGRHLGSAGRPLPGIEIRVVDQAGDQVAPGEVGEITVRGTGPPRQYYREEDASRQTWRDGWLHSGDLGSVDGDGFLWISGRSKDVIIRGGHNVVPGEVEEVLFAHPSVAEAVVAGIPHDVLGEDVGAWVVLREDTGTTASDLRAFLLERLADYKVPRALQIVESLPRNAAGKVVVGQLDTPDHPSVSRTTPLR
jgi:long-chain acyl-CoA synthetase